MYTEDKEITDRMPSQYIKNGWWYNECKTCIVEGCKVCDSDYCECEECKCKYCGCKSCKIIVCKNCRVENCENSECWCSMNAYDYMYDSD